MQPNSEQPTRRHSIVGTLSAFAAIALLVGVLGGVSMVGGLTTIENAALSAFPIVPAGRRTPTKAPAVAPATEPTTVPTTVPTRGTTPVDTATVVSLVRPGIVNINTELAFQGSAAAGTGMILTASGEVLTNNHVIDGATRISVSTAGGRRYPAHVVGTNRTADVAVLHLDGASDLTPIPIGDSTTAGVGQRVVALGNAGGKGGEPSIATGTIEATGQTITASDDSGQNTERLKDLIQINARIQPGDSGGALADATGSVIGMNTAASSGNRFASTNTTGFAIPIQIALSIAGQIESGAATPEIRIGLPGILGVQVDGTRQSSTAAPGALVVGVAQGLPADSVGVIAGDIITSIDGTAVSTSASLNLALRPHHPGDAVTIRWTDTSGRRHTSALALVAGPAD